MEERRRARTDFILDTVKQAAEDTILDQRVFVLDETQWQAFIAAPARPNERLMTLLARRPSWET